MSKATYEAAKAQYKKLGIDTEKAINTLKKMLGSCQDAQKENLPPKAQIPS